MLYFLDEYTCIWWRITYKRIKNKFWDHSTLQKKYLHSTNFMFSVTRLKAILQSYKLQPSFLYQSLCTYYSGWIQCLTLFLFALSSCGERGTSEKFYMKICLHRLSSQQPLVFQPGALDNFRLKLLHNYSIWMKSTRDNTCINLTMVRGELELTVRQNLNFFYQCRCYLLSVILQKFVWTHQNIINLIHVLPRVDFVLMPWFCKSLKYKLSSVKWWPIGPRRKVEKRRIAGSISNWDIYFHFESFLLLFFRSAQLSEADTNEIKHDIHSEK